MKTWLQHVHADVADARRRTSECVERDLHRRAYSPSALQSGVVCARVGQRMQVAALQWFQSQSIGDRIEHLVRDVAGATLLEPRVVVDADPG